MTEDQLKRLLARFYNGEYSPDEEQELFDWFEKASEAGTWHWTEEQKAAISSRLKQRIDVAISAPDDTARGWRYLKVAASVLLISACALLVWNNYRSLNRAEDRFVESVAGKGRQLKLKLSDGSTIHLNAGSKVKYPRDFSTLKIREVELIEGEAYFDVAHNKKPFVVTANKTRTHVLGTAFNIRSYGINRVEISVSRGKVGVTRLSKVSPGAEKAIYLLPGDQLSFNKQDGAFKKKRTSHKDIAGWIRGRLIFSNENLEDIGIILENTYGIKVRFARQDIGRIKFTANFDSSDPLNEILFAIAKANQLQYTSVNKEIIFSETTN